MGTPTPCRSKLVRKERTEIFMIINICYTGHIFMIMNMLQ